jgi:hypothetical protein
LDLRRNLFCSFERGSQESTLTEDQVRDSIFQLSRDLEANDSNAFTQNLQLLVENLKPTPCYSMDELHSLDFAKVLLSGQACFLEDFELTAVVFAHFAYIASFSDTIRSFLGSQNLFTAAVDCISHEDDTVCLWSIRICTALIEFVCDNGIEFDIGEMLGYLIEASGILNVHRTAIAFTVQAFVKLVDVAEFHTVIIDLLFL